MDRAWTTISPERFSWLVLDCLNDHYYVALPAIHVDAGHARAHCENYIAHAYTSGMRVGDAAFVLCNKIQTRAWRNDTHPSVPAELLTRRGNT